MRRLGSVEQEGESYLAGAYRRNQADLPALRPGVTTWLGIRPRPSDFGAMVDEALDPSSGATKGVDPSTPTRP